MEASGKAWPVLLAYADRLSQVLARADDNPMGRRYLEGKIKEARDAAEALGGPAHTKTGGQ